MKPAKGSRKQGSLAELRSNITALSNVKHWLLRTAAVY